MLVHYTLTLLLSCWAKDVLFCDLNIIELYVTDKMVYTCCWKKRKLKTFLYQLTDFIFFMVCNYVLAWLWKGTVATVNVCGNLARFSHPFSGHKSNNIWYFIISISFTKIGHYLTITTDVHDYISDLKNCSVRPVKHL